MSNSHGHVIDGTLQALIQFVQSHGLPPSVRVELRTPDNRLFVGATVEGDREIDPGDTVVIWLSDEEPAPNGDDDRRYSFEGYSQAPKDADPLAALLALIGAGVPGDGVPEDEPATDDDAS
jgi:hypothetical protein